jgi:hypothetical protein
MSTKKLRNDGESAVRVEYDGNVHVFDAGEEREVPAELADSAQFRYSDRGLHIVQAPPVEPKGVKLADAVLFVDEEAKASAQEAKAAADEDAAKAKRAVADAKADAAEEARDAKTVKATPHPSDLSAIFAPDLPPHPASTTAQATHGKEVAKDRHEEPAVNTVDSRDSRRKK